MGLKGSTVVNLVNAIVPLYLSIGLGYAMSKLKILTHEKHYDGIVAFCFKMTVPALVFQMVATNDPYNLNLKLVGADTLCKFLVLIVLSASAYFRPSRQCVEWVSTYFNLATMPNSVLIGIPLLTALYPGTEKDIIALVFMQCLLWFSVCIFILEIHQAVVENVDKDNQNKFDLEKQGAGENDQEVGNVETLSREATDMSENRNSLDIVVANGFDKEDTHASGFVEVRVVKLSGLRLVAKITRTVASKFFWSAVVWSSIIGFIYALLNFRFNDGKPLPTILKSSVQLLANCTLGMAMFMLGMHMAAQPTLMPGGIYKACLGAVVRFLVSPATMAVASLILGLRGEIFRFAVMQAMIPQAISSFVFASNYNVTVDIFSTAVWFQTLIFFPFAIALYTILELGA